MNISNHKATRDYLTKTLDGIRKKQHCRIGKITNALFRRWEHSVNAMTDVIIVKFNPDALKAAIYRNQSLAELTLFSTIGNENEEGCEYHAARMLRMYEDGSARCQLICKSSSNEILDRQVIYAEPICSMDFLAGLLEKNELLSKLGDFGLERRIYD